MSREKQRQRKKTSFRAPRPKGRFARRVPLKSNESRCSPLWRALRAIARQSGYPRFARLAFGRGARRLGCRLAFQTPCQFRAASCDRSAPCGPSGSRFALRQPDAYGAGESRGSAHPLARRFAMAFGQVPSEASLLRCISPRATRADARRIFPAPRGECERSPQSRLNCALHPR